MEKNLLPHVRPGDFIHVTDVVTRRVCQQFEKCETPVSIKNVIVEGIRVNRQAYLLLKDSICRNIGTELLQMALSKELDPVPNEESAITDGTVALHVNIQLRVGIEPTSYGNNHLGMKSKSAIVTTSERLRK